MKNQEVFDIFDTHFKESLLGLGFKKSGRKYTLTISSDLKFVFNIQPDRWGWFEEEGGRFTYSLMPIYKKCSVFGIVGIQVQFGDVIKRRPDLAKNIATCMNQYNNKLSGSTMRRLAHRWTEKKVVKDIDSWFFYYDEKDVNAWQELLKPFMLDLIKEDIDILKSTDIKLFEESINQDAQHATMYVDPDTGKTVLIDKETDEKINS